MVVVGSVQRPVPRASSVPPLHLAQQRRCNDSRSTTISKAIDRNGTEKECCEMAGSGWTWLVFDDAGRFRPGHLPTTVIISLDDASWLNASPLVKREALHCVNK